MAVVQFVPGRILEALIELEGSSEKIALVDGDGDKVFWAFTDLGDGKGKAVFEGGTGKYQGLQGSEDYEFVYTPDAPEGTFHGHGGSNGSYKLP